MKTAALYVHVPFCEHKCIYCDFYSVITQKDRQNYLEAVKTEIDSFADQYNDLYEFDTIFFGGGTPSLLAPRELDSLMNYFLSRLRFSSSIEITLETNPGTIDETKLFDFNNAGINRLSIGIQSFQQNDLEFLTRIHNRQQAIDAVAGARKAGFKNINIDLMFNIPGQSESAWQENLAVAVDLGIDHISAYSLIIERGTILHKMILTGSVSIGDTDYDAELYMRTIQFLSANGFHQYEVSNFARTGFECRHNLHYWKYDDYFGVGPSAHSFLNSRRKWNYTSLTFYLDAVKRAGIGTAGSEQISNEQARDEYVMLALRSKGLSIKEFEKRFGAGWIQGNEKLFQQLADQNYIIRSDAMIRLSAAGYAVCDEILARILK